MAQQTVKLPASPGGIHFTNGTTVSGLQGCGFLRQRTRDAGTLRSATVPAEIDTTVQFDQALALHGIQEQETLVVDATQIDPPAGDVVSLEFAPAAGRHVVLYQDESGGLSWHLEELPTPGRPGLRGRSSVQIPLRTAAVQTTMRAGIPRSTLRGPLTVLGRKIFKVFILPVATRLLAAPTEWFADKVESHYCRNLVWAVTAENYQSRPANDAAPDWQALTKGPVLLIIHGIFSSVEGMLAGLPPAAMESWCRLYEGRVIAFNHLTASVAPEQNAAFFLQQVQAQLPDTPITFDILCHSRGGIVSRALSERASAIAPTNRVEVRSVYFVATPNAGSAIGDADHMSDMIDTFTNCLANLPDGPVSYSIEVVVGLLMLLGNGAEKALPGISAMQTKGGYIENTLNASRTKIATKYGAVASDFEPRPGRENGWFIDRLAYPLLDEVFAVDGTRVSNDIVVPQLGVFAANGHPSFPIDAPLVFQPKDGVWHTAFFAQPRTVAAIDAFFRHVAARAEADEPEEAIARVLRGELRSINESEPSTAKENPIDVQTPNVDLGDELEEATARVLRGVLRSINESESSMAKEQENPIGVQMPNAGLGPAQSKPADILQREVKAEFPDSVLPGEVSDFVVNLLAVSTPGSTNVIRFPIAAGADKLDLTAYISAPGFKVHGSRQATIVVHRQSGFQKEGASFTLEASPVPDGGISERTIDVSFWMDNDCVGGVSRHCFVGEKPASAVAEPAIKAPAGISIDAWPRRAADLVLYVRKLTGSLYTLSVSCGVPSEEYPFKDFGSIDLAGNELADYIASIIEPSFKVFPGSSVPDSEYADAVKTWNEQFIGLLKDFGKQLWLFLPEAFRAEYLRLMTLDRGPISVSVYSEDMVFPWELVIPSGTINGKYLKLPAWGKSHVLGRWQLATNTRPQPQAVAVKKMSVLVTSQKNSGLPWAKAEADGITGLLNAARTVSPVTRPGIDALLDSNDVQWVHFSGHGSSNQGNADLSYVELDSTPPLSALSFASNRLAAEAHPVLYLNACSVGKSGSVLGRPSGFAGNCIAAGWSGVVAPYWPIYDQTAKDFSIAFYRKLKSGLAIGEALQQLRVEKEDDPTAQSYAYFGDPFAHYLFS